jgi:biotin/methionine sulfoxide reductase
LLFLGGRRQLSLFIDPSSERITMSGFGETLHAMLNSSHWGVFDPLVVEGRIAEARPFPKDPDPSPIIRSIPDAVHHPCRVAQPAVRAGWLKHGPGKACEGRGGDRFVPVTWERALALVEHELKRVISNYGNEAIFGGSYDWSSAGRFRHR